MSRTVSPGSGARRRVVFGFVSPVGLWLALFVVAPYGILLLYAIWKTNYVTVIHQFTLGNFRQAATDPVLRTVALRSAGIAVTVTAVSFVLAFTLAYLGAFHVKRKKLFVFAVVLPLWVSYVVRAFAWRIILGDHGIMNETLQAIGVIHQPISALLFSPTAVVLLMTHEYLPFMFVPLYGVLDAIPRGVLQAAGDLYGSPLRRFLHVTLPLSVPGIAAGVMFVLPLSFGDYIAPDLVGGPNSTMVGSLVAQQYGVTFDLPYGATLALGILLGVLLVIAVMQRWQKLEEIQLT